MKYLFCLFMAVVTIGCVTTPPDYTAFREHKPSSILVLPPVNQSLEVPASHSYYSIISRPIAEMGYYVFPVALVDGYLKENGIVTPEQSHQLPAKKLREIFGADAAFYVTIQDWGNKYEILSSTTRIKVDCKLVDLKNGKLLWHKNHFAFLDSGSGGGGLLGLAVKAVIVQIVRENNDDVRKLAKTSSFQMIHNNVDGFLPGPFKKFQSADQTL